MKIPPGTIVANQYEILGPLGRGGMGELFRARNVRTERRVALKLLRPDTKGRADAIERFRREARAAGMISSDHVTQVLDVEDDPRHGIAIAFELLEGESLLERLRRTGPMPLDVLHPLCEQMLRGLIDAHGAGIIHRDLKPSNVFLEKRPDGSSRVKILDFGISKLPKAIAKTTLTEPGQSLGSFMFMPPEQIQRAANVDQRADIYALGSLVFQALTGHLPYSAQNMVELIQAKTTTAPRTLEQASGRPFAPALQQWVTRTLMMNRDQRFQSAEEAAAEWRLLATAPSPPAYSGRPSQPGAAVASTTSLGGNYATSSGLGAARPSPGGNLGAYAPLPAGYEPLPMTQRASTPTPLPVGGPRSSPSYPGPVPSSSPHPAAAPGYGTLPSPAVAPGASPSPGFGPAPPLAAAAAWQQAPPPPSAALPSYTPPPPSSSHPAVTSPRRVPVWLLVGAIVLVLGALGVSAAVALTLLGFL